ncbi:MAG: hypothetical protein LBU27_07660 [Candidatus Peribacteria bacterium]|jgi:hypothetical protein|nr:hypothetical protein [Candidatus Peribacteria bacterium]
MNTTNLIQQETATTALISPHELPNTNNHYTTKLKLRQQRRAHEEAKETRRINDNGTFIIEKTQDSLLENNNARTTKMSQNRTERKDDLIDNFHALAEYKHPSLAEYKHPLKQRHMEINVVADGESNATPVVEIREYNQAA